MSQAFRLVGHIQALTDHDVAYVIVGEVSGRIQGVPTSANHMDIVPDLSPVNLERLASALSGPGTTKKSRDSTVYAPHPDIRPEEFWSERMTQYQTVNGGIVVLIELPGVGPYDLLVRRSRRYVLRDLDIKIEIASLDDVITSMEFTDRPKDWRALGVYYEARAQLAEHGEG